MKQNLFKSLFKPSFSLLTIAGSALAVTGCMDTVQSNQVNASAVYQSYSLRYDQSSNTMSASAQFTVGDSLGTTLALTAPAQVLFDGQSLTEVDFLGTSYDLSESGYNASSHCFDFTDQSGNHYHNCLSVNPISVTQAPTTLAYGSSYSLQLSFSGAAPESNETFSAEFTQNQGNSAQIMLVNGEIAANGTLTLPSSELFASSMSLQAGAAQVTIIRSSYGSLQAATSEGGMLSSEYRATPFNITVQ